ncbi:copper resistance system multicopper oxidase [Acaryochloris sp. CCMEE 5410]|uniref:copper resistance system multicopper oxidase n=1 Tax=Acaryochloris sp. CCMEE 5410 TaxID=310037 RepID=UPI0002483EDF|nr:copper resistance system multicopper oxidase [Acaryochloris sp. CCMEE 5410]KAI9130087.1 copper resistance system multicopper oxidase [Acaryochloris sp. CCMEE 5410]
MGYTAKTITRRNFIRFSAGMGLALGFDSLVPKLRAATARVAGGSQTYPDIINLQVQKTRLAIAGKETPAITSNGSIPGPLVRLREGQTATIKVTNQLKEDTSIHWHGILLPPEMDGVPGVSFAGIKPGETFTYSFPVQQSGTYWYHSHSGVQEQMGHFGALIVDPLEPEPFDYQQDYVVTLSDWTFEDPHSVLANLKKMSAYYNYNRRTVATLFKDLPWKRMRMDPTDLADVTGATYTYLMNGMAPDSNWTGLFQPGEKVRLRFINASAMTFFDVRIPGLKMTVVQADGQNIQPVPVDEFRIAVAETYDVIVEPQDEQAYTIFAETMDRSGYARGTLAPRQGMTAPIPEQRPRVMRSMADMGMMHDMSGMDSGGTDTMQHNMSGNGSSDMQNMQHNMSRNGSGGMNHMQHDMSGMKSGDMGNMQHDMSGMSSGDMNNMQHNMPGKDNGGMNHMQHNMSGMNSGDMTPHGPDGHGPGNAGVPMMLQSRLDDPGIGLENTGTRVLLYTDLRSLTPREDQRQPEREIELHLTGNMERYMWSFDGKKYSQAKEPIQFRNGERLRLTFINDTMMEHPIHLHGMWMELVNGAGSHQPRKHTLNVKPAEKVSVDVTVDAPGNWAFHCHLLYHMEVGMFRVVSVTNQIAEVNS